MVARPELERGGALREGITVVGIYGRRDVSEKDLKGDREGFRWRWWSEASWEWRRSLERSDLDALTCVSFLTRRAITFSYL